MRPIMFKLWEDKRKVKIRAKELGNIYIFNSWEWSRELSFLRTLYNACKRRLS